VYQLLALLGVNLRVKKIDVSYSRATYHLTGSTNNFSITTNPTAGFKV
jgi:hypothetical protein